MAVGGVRRAAVGVYFCNWNTILLFPHSRSPSYSFSRDEPARRSLEKDNYLGTFPEGIVCICALRNHTLVQVTITALNSSKKSRKCWIDFSGFFSGMPKKSVWSCFFRHRKKERKKIKTAAFFKNLFLLALAHVPLRHFVGIVRFLLCPS